MRDRLVRPFRAAVIASLLAGIPAGIAARIAMDLLGNAGGSSLMAVVGQFTVLGTLRIIMTPMLFGIPFAWLLLGAGRLWADRAWPIRAAAYAAACVILPGLLFMTDSELHIPGPNSTLGPWLFLPTFIIYGAGVGLIGDRLLRRGRESIVHAASD